MEPTHMPKNNDDFVVTLRVDKDELSFLCTAIRKYVDNFPRAKELPPAESTLAEKVDEAINEFVKHYGTAFKF